MEKAMMLAAIIGPMYLLYGLSILLYVKQWKKLMKKLTADHFDMFVGMFVSLLLGLILVNMYNVWDKSIYVVITLTGWGALLKGAFYLLAPSSMIKSTLKWQNGLSEGFLQFEGLILTIIGALLSYNVYLVA